MNAAALLDDLTGRGFRLRAEDDRIVIRPFDRLTDADRATIVANKPGLLALLRNGSANPLMTPEQGNECHAPAWTEVETRTFLARRDRLVRWGRSEQEAEDIAERLTLRDRESDDRRMCAECGHGTHQRCPDGMPMPIATLHRCPSFRGGAA